MVFRKKCFFITCSLYFSSLFGRGIGGEVCAQIQDLPDAGKLDSLFFLNGEIRAVKIVDTAYHLIRFFPEKKTTKPHLQEVEKDKIFSLKFSNGQKKIIYSYDTTLGNVFSVLEAKMFMLGEQEADRSYKNKWPAIIGFAVGITSPLVLSNAVVLSPVPAAVTPLHVLVPIVKIDTKEIRNKNYLRYDTYLMGYEKVARKKNFMHSIWGAGAGLLSGFAIWAIRK